MILLKIIKVKDAWFATIVFFNHGFKLQDSVCNGCHELTMVSFNISDIAIITFKNVDCCCIHNISKSEVINLLESVVLENGGYM